MSSAKRRRFAGALLVTTALTGVGGLQEAHAAAAQTQAAATGLEEVVVTARRRTEDLQSTPVSVTALSNDLVNQLNIREFTDLRFAVPNLEVGNMATGGTSMTIRGIGQGSSQVNVDAKAGFYIDEMYVARQEGNQLYFYDIDNLQVLKGPQGTLFGKNTTAGAVLLTTARPSADGGGYAKIRLGSFRRIDTEGAINAAISDQILTRFSWRTQNADGYIKHVLDDETNNDTNDQSARFQVRLLPNSDLTIDWLAEYNKSDTNGPASIMYNCRPTAAYQRNYNSLHTVPFCTAYPVLGEDYLVYGGATLSIPTSSLITDVAAGGDSKNSGLTRGGHVNPYNNTDVITTNLRVQYDLTENLFVKSISAYRRSSARWYSPNSNVPNDIYSEHDITNTNQFTQEVNLNGIYLDGRLNFVLGGYYFQQSTNFIQDTGPDWIDPVGYLYDGHNRFKSWAGYGQASFKVIEPVEITVGARYSHDTKNGMSDVFLQTVFTAPNCNNFVNAFKSGSAVCGGHLLGADEDSWSSFDPKGQISWQVTPDLFVYGTIAKGYNAGGFNQQLGSDVAKGRLVSYEPERLTSYEIGVKSEWWERRLRLNAAAFKQDYQDIQTTVQITVNGVATRQVQTGASAREEGVEADLEFVPISNLRLRANMAYLHQEYTSVRPGVSFTVQTPVTTAPKFTYSGSAAYTWYLPSDAAINASINWRASGKRPSCNPVGTCYLPSYGYLGGRIDFQTADGTWAAAAYVTNALDKQAPSAFNAGTGAMGVDNYTPGRPREFGIEVRRAF